MHKEMKIAQIVPKTCLELTANNQYHMCLAHLALADKTYGVNRIKLDTGGIRK